MRAAHRGCAQSERHLLHGVAAAPRVVTARDPARSGRTAIEMSCRMPALRHLKRPLGRGPAVRPLDARHRAAQDARSRAPAQPRARGPLDANEEYRLRSNRIPSRCRSRYPRGSAGATGAVVTALALEGGKRSSNCPQARDEAGRGARRAASRARHAGAQVRRPAVTIPVPSTADLIARLAHEAGADADGGRPHIRSVALRLALATGGAALMVLLILLTLFTRSPHFGQFRAPPSCGENAASALLLGGAAFAAALALSRPEAAGSALPVWLPATILLAAGVAAELALVPRSEWFARMVGGNPLACLAGVFTLSLPLLFGALWALRAGAPARPHVTGALAGLLAGGVTEALYLLHCRKTRCCSRWRGICPPCCWSPCSGAALGGGCCVVSGENWPERPRFDLCTIPVRPDTEPSRPIFQGVRCVQGRSAERAAHSGDRRRHRARQGNGRRISRARRRALHLRPAQVGVRRDRVRTRRQDRRTGDELRRRHPQRRRRSTR